MSPRSFATLIVTALFIAAFLYVVAQPTAAERQRALDASCPAQQPVVRYPAEMGGPHPAVCQPTMQTWRN